MSSDAELPIRTEIYDRRFGYLDTITNPRSVKGSVRYNARGTFTYELDPGDDRLQDLMRPGARVRLEYRDRGLCSGVVRPVSGPLVASDTGTVSVQVVTDWRMLENTLAFPAPTRPLRPTALSGDASLAQSWQVNAAGPAGTVTGRRGYYQWEATTWEGAIKELISSQLLTRLGRPIDVAPDLGRGGSVVASQLPMARMGRVSDYVSTMLATSGLGLRILQPSRSDRVLIDVFEPDTWHAPLTVASGVVAEGTWSLVPPNATRTIVGGPGEEAARAFYGVADTATEDIYGDVIEVFRDATGATLEWPDSLSELYRVPAFYDLRTEVPEAAREEFRSYLHHAGADGLEEHAPTAGASVKLSESESFYFGGTDGVQLGTRVEIEPDGLNAPKVSDVITEAEFSLTADAFSIVPVVGNRPRDTYAMTLQQILAVAAAQRKMSAGR